MRQHAPLRNTVKDGTDKVNVYKKITATSQR